MRYLKPFNESKESDEFDFSEWVPKCLEYMNILLEVKNKSMSIGPTLKRFMAKISLIDDINKLIIEYPSLFKDDLNLSEKILLFNKNGIRLSELGDIYLKWVEIRKLDIKVYMDLLDIIEDISDNNKSSFSFYEVEWANNVNYMYFEFIIYDGSLVKRAYNGRSGERLLSDTYISLKKADGILEDIRSSVTKERLKALSCDNVGYSYEVNIVRFKIRFKA